MFPDPNKRFRGQADLSHRRPSLSRHGYRRRMAIYTGTYTQESMLKMFLRPFGLIFLPAVAYAVMIWAVTIGFLVAVTGNFAVALAYAHGFTPTQSGYCFGGGLIGALLGIPGGGILADYVVKRATHKNGGGKCHYHTLLDKGRRRLNEF